MINEQGSFTEEFTQKLPDMLGDNFYNDPETKQQPTKIFENVKDMKTLVNSFANAQRKISASEKDFAERTAGMVKVPGDESSLEEVTAFRKATGVPESADQYEINIPADNTDEVLKEMAGVVKQASFEVGAPASMVAKIWPKVMEHLQGIDARLEEAGKTKMAEDIEALKDQYKDGYDDMIKITDKSLSMPPTGKAFAEVLETMGINNHPAVRNFLNEIAPLIVEGKTFGGVDDGAGGDEPWFTNYDAVDQDQQNEVSL